MVSNCVRSSAQNLPATDHHKVFTFISSSLLDIYFQLPMQSNAPVCNKSCVKVFVAADKRGVCVQPDRKKRPTLVIIKEFYKN